VHVPTNRTKCNLLSQNFTGCVTTRHDSTSTTCRAVSCVLRRACSNTADDEEALVLACKTISCFIAIYYFSSQIKLIRLLKRITAIITLYTLQTKLRIAPVALVVTCCVALAVQHARHSTHDLFLYQNTWAR